MDYLILDAMGDLVSNYSVPEDFQRGVFWAYSEFDESCEVTFSNSQITIHVIAPQDTSTKGLIARLEYDVATNVYGSHLRNVPESMPFQTVVVKYLFQDETSPVVTCTLDVSNVTGFMPHPEIERADREFAEGFGE